LISANVDLPFSHAFDTTRRPYYKPMSFGFKAGFESFGAYKILANHSSYCMTIKI